MIDGDFHLENVCPYFRKFSKDKGHQRDVQFYLNICRVHESRFIKKK